MLQKTEAPPSDYCINAIGAFLPDNKPDFVREVALLAQCVPRVDHSFVRCKALVLVVNIAFMLCTSVDCLLSLPQL